MASAESSVNVSVKLNGKPIPGLSSVVYDGRLRQLTTDANGVTTCTCANGQTRNIDLAISTLPAHSYDFVVQNPNANGTNNHRVQVDFALSTPSVWDVVRRLALGRLTLLWSK
jgi:hypothetical protein